MGEAQRRKKLDPTYGKPKTDFLEHIFSDPILKQIALIFTRCKVKNRLTGQMPEEESVVRMGKALQLKTQSVEDCLYLCEHYQKLCDFIELIEDKPKPDFIVVDQPNPWGDSLFIVRETRKTYSSTEKEEITISR